MQDLLGSHGEPEPERPAPGIGSNIVSRGISTHSTSWEEGELHEWRPAGGGRQHQSSPLAEGGDRRPQPSGSIGKGAGQSSDSSVLSGPELAESIIYGAVVLDQRGRATSNRSDDGDTIDMILGEWTDDTTK